MNFTGRGRKETWKFSRKSRDPATERKMVSWLKQKYNCKRIRMKTHVVKTYCQASPFLGSVHFGIEFISCKCFKEILGNTTILVLTCMHTRTSNLITLFVKLMQAIVFAVLLSCVLELQCLLLFVLAPQQLNLWQFPCLNFSFWYRYRHQVELVRFLNQFADRQRELPTGWDKKIDQSGRVRA